MAEYVFPEGDNSSPRRLTFEASREMWDNMYFTCISCSGAVLGKYMEKHMEWHSKLEERLSALELAVVWDGK